MARMVLANGTNNATVNSMELTERERSIVEILEKAEKPQRMSEIYAAVGAQRNQRSVSRRTLIRDLRRLVEGGLLAESGGGRTMAYAVSPSRIAHVSVDVEKYFAKSGVARHARHWFDNASYDVFTDDMFTREEHDRLRASDVRYREAKRELEQNSPAILKRELERLVIELSWKSSEIEGNTYTLLETEALIKEHELARGKDKAEAQMILNHKVALDYILSHAAEFTSVDAAKIIRVHGLLSGGLGISEGFRDHPVGITGTVYRPPGNARRIAEAMDRLTAKIASMHDPFVRSFTILAMIAYIQPFEDGNKRTARIMANALLFAAGTSMLSYRSVEASEYRKAMILFYERNNIAYLKRIFLEQFEFAVLNYFASDA